MDNEKSGNHLNNLIKHMSSRGSRLRGRRLINVSFASRRGGTNDATATTVSTATAKTRSSVDVFAGGAARAAAQATIHPLDTIKVRMQAPSAKPLSVKAKKLAQQSLKSVAKKAGSLYNGVWSAAGGAGLAIGAHFAFYGLAKRCIEDIAPNLSLGIVAFTAGAIGAAGASIVKVPAAVCIRSVQARVYPNAITAAIRICKAVGPRGLYTGFLPTILEDVPDTAVKFAIYEMLQAVVAKSSTSKDRSKATDAVIGGVAGACAAGATTPLDVIKTRMMVSASCKPNMLTSCSEIIAEKRGLSPFLSGMGPRSVSSFINSAVFFAFFECLRRTFAANEFDPLRRLKSGKGQGVRRRGSRRSLPSRNVQVDLAEATVCAGKK